MQIIVFKKSGPDAVSRSTVHLKMSSVEDSLNEMIQPGTVIMIKKTDFHALENYFQASDVLNCGIKKDWIELKRALKLDLKNKQDQPRRLIVNFTTLASIKKSVLFFIEKGYKHTDPACILFSEGKAFDELIQSNNSRSGIRKSSDPISGLLENTADQFIISQLSRILVGNSLGMRLTRTMIFKASQARSPVLILGESGTGKELIARKIFEYTKYFDKDFVVVNCSAIPDALFESELFGHIKGSFTNAIKDKEGLFVTAKGGTLFLDEIGDLSLMNQAKLLRTLESGEIKPVGSNVTFIADVRILAATNRNLFAMMKQGTFREDLFYRLNSFTIYTAPLRENPDDIPLIASSIWKEKLNKKNNLSKEFLNYLKNYPWPGNVRELKTLLNTINDLFTNVKPGPEHIIAIRKYQNNKLTASKSTDMDDAGAMLKAQSQARIIEVQNILRAIKIELRPMLNLTTKKVKAGDLQKIRNLVEYEINRLEDLCREPIFFKSRQLFDRITRFRYLLDKVMQGWHKVPEQIPAIWQSELKPLYESIDQEIFELVWGKIDL